MSYSSSLFFFFNDTATTEIYTLSLHDALPIYEVFFLDQHVVHERVLFERLESDRLGKQQRLRRRRAQDRKSTRLNSSHLVISYAVFCLKKKKQGSVAQQGKPANFSGR